MIVVFCGRRVQGKTTAAWWTATQSERDAVIILDPRKMFVGGVVLTSIDDDDDADAVYDAIEHGQAVVIQPRDTDAVPELAALLFDLVEDFPRRRFVVLVDEAHMFKSELDARDWQRCFKLIDYNRVLFLLTFHRPTDVSRDVRAIVHAWCLFRVSQPDDLDIVRRQCGADVADAVRNLPDRNFVYWNDGIGRAKSFQNPRQWYVPLDVAPMCAHRVPA